ARRVHTRARTGVWGEPHDSSPGHHRCAPGHSRPRGARPVRPLAVNAAAKLKSLAARGLQCGHWQSDMLTFLSLMFGTLVSEDLACVTAGLLIQRGQVEASSAVLAYTLGIFAADVGLWAIRRKFGCTALAWARAAGRLELRR